jgi:DNA-binding MarR family transcriptional regulator
MTLEAEYDQQEGPVLDEVRGMPGHLLRRFQQIAVSIFLKDCREFDITPVQFSILAALYRSAPLDQNGLSGYSALDRTTVSVVVRKLEERGLIRRKTCARDRRSKLITMTEEGERLMREIMPKVRAVQDKTLAPLTETERQTFMALLRKAVNANNDESRAPLRSL